MSMQLLSVVGVRTATVEYPERDKRRRWRHVGVPFILYRINLLVFSLHGILLSRSGYI